MHKLLRLAFGAALLFTTIALAAQEVSPVSASLVIPDRKVLPGVPFEMWIDVANRSDSVVAIGLFPTLLVKKDGQSFEIAPQGNTGNFPYLWEDRGRRVPFLELAPGEKETLTFPIAGDLRGAEFFEDYRINGPGRYEFSIRLSKFPKSPAGSIPLTYRGTATTGEVAVERSEPRGTDAKVWQRMQTLGHGKWASTSPFLTDEGGKLFDIWRVIPTEYPDSNYVPYALACGIRDTPDYLTQVLGAIDQFPDSPARDLLFMRAFAATSGSSATVHGSRQIRARAEAALQASKRATIRAMVFGRDALRAQ